jgi:glucose/arabinose dehydrogenase/cytochrome c2
MRAFRRKMPHCNQRKINMRQWLIGYLALCLGPLGASPLLGADAADGKRVFREQCALCHSAQPGDDGGAQGPSLAGVYGRRAGSEAHFSYSQALSASGITWDGATLTRFLASPTTLVPGTAMVLAVANPADRDNLVAYFQSLHSSTALSTAGGAPAGSRLAADWKFDAPGRAHRVDLAALPAPYATSSASNSPRVVAAPTGSALALPAGFHVQPFATQLKGPRRMLVASNGDIFVTEMAAGRVSILHASADGARAASIDVFQQGLQQPFGMAFYPNSADPRWLYVAETNRVIRYPYRTGDLKPRGDMQVVVPHLPSGGGHTTRDIVFSADGKQMFVSVGSASNVADSMRKKSPADIKAWESAQGLGAAWDNETQRADVLVFDAAAPTQAKIFAAGIRNCVGLTLQPANGALWCTTNERDALGDDLVPDYSTRIRAGEFYGWPWYYMGTHEDPRLHGDRPDLLGKVRVPDIPYQAHSAALGMTFYAASDGRSAFPAGYVGDAFVAFHGSWNRSLRTGYKLVRVHMKNAEPTGDYEDFLTGFVTANGDVWGRPVATAQLKDGSVLMSEDAGNVIFRIFYAP